MLSDIFDYFSNVVLTHFIYFLFICKIYLSLFTVVVIAYFIIKTPNICLRLLQKKNPYAIAISLVIVSVFFFPLTRNIMIITSVLILSIYCLGLIESCRGAYLIRKGEKWKWKKSNISINKNNKYIIKNNENLKNITIIFSLKNESNVICRSLDKIFQLDYPQDKINVIVINDYSTDNTLDVLEQYSENHSITVISNINEAGKASALNSVLENITTELVLIMDADHHISKDFIKKAVKYFRNPEVGMVQGMNVIRNGNQSIISKLVEMEYHGLHQIIYYVKPMPVYLGTSAIFRSDIFKITGLFKNELATEDWELSFRMHQKCIESIFCKDCYTDELAPVTINSFYKQRYRWLRGTWQCIETHFSNMILSKNIQFTKKIDFVSVCIFPLALLSYLCINTCWGLDYFNLITLPIFPDTVLILQIPFILFYIQGIIYSKKYKTLPVVVLVPYFYTLYSLAAFEAMFDEWILKRKYHGEKMDRSSVNN